VSHEAGGRGSRGVIKLDPLDLDDVGQTIAESRAGRDVHARRRVRPVRWLVAMSVPHSTRWMLFALSEPSTRPCRAGDGHTRRARGAIQQRLQVAMGCRGVIAGPAGSPVARVGRRGPCCGARPAARRRAACAALGVPVGLASAGAREIPAPRRAGSMVMSRVVDVHDMADWFDEIRARRHLFTRLLSRCPASLACGVSAM